MYVRKLSSVDLSANQCSNYPIKPLNPIRLDQEEELSFMYSVRCSLIPIIRNYILTEILSMGIATTDSPDLSSALSVVLYSMA